MQITLSNMVLSVSDTEKPFSTDLSFLRHDLHFSKRIQTSRLRYWWDSTRKEYKIALWAYFWALGPDFHREPGETIESFRVRLHLSNFILRYTEKPKYKTDGNNNSGTDLPGEGSEEQGAN